MLDAKICGQRLIKAHFGRKIESIFLIVNHLQWSDAENCEEGL